MVEIKPAKFKKIPHASGGLIVFTQLTNSFTLSNVAPFDVDEKYLVRRRSIFGPNWVTLNLLIETNMELYVLTQDKKMVKNQPAGYPKTGKKTDE